MDDLISRQDAIDAMIMLGIKRAIPILETLPSAELERKKGRKFLEIVTEYPKICTYPEYEGKPYYSIKYEENGEMIVGFGTYKSEVLSQYLREYFIPFAEPEQKTGKWKPFDLTWGRSIYSCTACGEAMDIPTEKSKPIYSFCPHCGADMRGE